MYILSFKEGHDPAACLLKDGEIIAAVEEERFIRKKHAPGVFPVESIRFCLKFAGIKEQDVDYVVYARLKPWQTFIEVFRYYFTNLPGKKLEWRYFVSHMKVQFKGVFLELTNRANYQKIHKFFPYLPKKIYSFDHHLCHAASSYYFSRFRDSLIITMDGKGESTSVMLAEGRDNNIKILERKGIFQSLGGFYASFTKHLGFTPNDGEYKVMGLASYGSPDLFFDDVLAPDEEKGYRINSDFCLYPFFGKNFEKKFGKPREKDGEITKYHMNLAASIQKALDNSVVSLVKYGFKKTKSRNLCLAGGVALNVKTNKAVWESGLTEHMFIQPAAGDAGLVFGAAALLYKEITGKRVKSLGALYFGPEYGNEEIKTTFERHKLKYHFCDDSVGRVVDLLVSGKVVGWFQGRMEFGPRALGNRSILANPGDKAMKDIVNKKIKFREEFRPFCPSILSEFAGEYLKHYTDSPYMVMSFSIKDAALINKIPAVVHVDDTVRPQAVDKNSSPLYYELISRFRDKTDIPVLLNTSMNVRGEPIVCSPEDLVNFFLKTNVDAVAAGNFLITKEDQRQEILNSLPKGALSNDY